MSNAVEPFAIMFQCTVNHWLIPNALTRMCWGNSSILPAPLNCHGLLSIYDNIFFYGSTSEREIWWMKEQIARRKTSKIFFFFFRPLLWSYFPVSKNSSARQHICAFQRLPCLYLNISLIIFQFHTNAFTLSSNDCAFDMCFKKIRKNR